jgi:hypothetical protein
MSGTDFEDKATRLLSRLTATSQVPAGLSKNKAEMAKLPMQDLSRLREELEYSELDTRKRVKGLNDSLRKLEGSLAEENQLRVQKGRFERMQRRPSALPFRSWKRI